MEKVRSFAVLDNGSGEKLFVKNYQDNVRIEYEKAEQMYMASLNSNYFLTPRPLHLIEEHGIIVWEYLSNLLDLRSFLCRTRAQTSEGKKLHGNVLHKCGQALGAIHSFLNLTGDHHIQKVSIRGVKHLPDLDHHIMNILDQSPMKYVHGDFGCANIFVQFPIDGEPQIVILDATPNLFLFDRVSPNVLATPYLDLAQFISSLNSKTSFYFKFRRDLPFFSEEFLKGYEEVTSYTIDRPTAFTIAAEILLVYREYQKIHADHKTWDSWWAWHFRRWNARNLLKIAIQRRTK